MQAFIFLKGFAVIMVEKSEKEARFRRLAAQRTNSVLKKLDILGNCANKSAYSYTEEEVNKIFNEIDRCVKETKLKFNFSKRDRKEFKL